MKTIKLPRKSRTAKAAPPVFCPHFVHARVQYRSAFCPRGAFGLIEIDDVLFEARPRGQDASGGFVLVACATNESVEVELSGGRAICSCGAAQTRPNFGTCSPCTHARGVERLLAEGSI